MSNTTYWDVSRALNEIFKVRLIPPAMHDQYRLEVGEPWFCNHWNPDYPGGCGGRLAEIALGPRLVICRYCAKELAETIASCVELLEAATLSNWLGKEEK